MVSGCLVRAGALVGKPVLARVQPVVHRRAMRHALGLADTGQRATFSQFLAAKLGRGHNRLGGPCSEVSAGPKRLGQAARIFVVLRPLAPARSLAVRVLGPAGWFFA